MEEKINIDLQSSIVEELLDGTDKNKDPALVSVLLLAYLGDSIFDLVIRTMYVKRGNRQVNKINKDVTSLVSAPAQAQMADALKASFTDEEKDIYRRGRNSKPKTKAKNASQQEYHKATGFEAVLGYLYLKGDRKRLLEIVASGVKILNKNLQE